MKKNTPLVDKNILPKCDMTGMMEVVSAGFARELEHKNNELVKALHSVINCQNYAEKGAITHEFSAILKHCDVVLQIVNKGMRLKHS